MPEKIKVTLKDPNNIFNGRKFLTIGSYTILTGCNGAGKTTICKDIVSWCKEHKYHYMFCDGSNDFHEKDADRLSPNYGIGSVLMSFWESEHEHIERMFGDFIKKTRPGDEFKGKDFFLIIDGLDSGGDVLFYRNHISLFRCIVEDALTRGIYMHLIVTCNNFYYLCHSGSAETIFVPTFRKVKGLVYKDTEYSKYVDDIMETVKARGFKL